MPCRKYSTQIQRAATWIYCSLPDDYRQNVSTAHYAMSIARGCRARCRCHVAGDVGSVICAVAGRGAQRDHDSGGWSHYCGWTIASSRSSQAERNPLARRRRMKSGPGVFAPPPRPLSRKGIKRASAGCSGSSPIAAGCRRLGALAFIVVLVPMLRTRNCESSIGLKRQLQSTGIILSGFGLRDGPHAAVQNCPRSLCISHSARATSLACRPDRTDRFRVKRPLSVSANSAVVHCL